MTTTEFINEFDILYNSIASQSAPSIDIYEKSTYLTKAQLELVKNYYNPKGNKYQEGFENSEKRRVDLKELVADYKSSKLISPSMNRDNVISEDSAFFSIPNDVFLIIFEECYLTTIENCPQGKWVKVIPKTHDEYNYQIKNPFKRPDSNNVWRLDIREQLPLSDGSLQIPRKVVELVTSGSIPTYHMRYIKYPEPIILGDLTTLFPFENLSIEGVSTEQTCKLSDSVHREILDRAVELALRDYKPSNLESKIQLDTRNE